MADFDYWSWWKLAVSKLNIQPDKAWKLDFVELMKLTERKQSNIDTSIMLNFERTRNGASRQWLQRG